MTSERIRRLVALGSIAAVVVVAPTAQGAVQVGQVSGELEPNNCPGGYALITTAVASGIDYVVPAGGGVITEWRTAAGPAANAKAKLKVFQATGDPNQFLVVGQSDLRNLTPGAMSGPSAINSFPTRVPVQAGDYVSLRTSDEGPCNIVTGLGGDSSRLTAGQPDTATGMNTMFTFTSPGERANVRATLEPDADGDGFGDETQDQCVGTAGSSNGCVPAISPVSHPPPANKPKKKCKKAKKRTAAASGVIGKRCKKKKKK